MNNWDKVPKYLQEKIDEHIFKIEPKQETSIVEDLQDIENHLDKMNDRHKNCPDCIKLDGQQLSPDCCHNHKQETFEEAVEPLMKWMCENQHPHTTVIVTGTRAELVEGLQCHLNDKFIVD